MLSYDPNSAMASVDGISRSADGYTSCSQYKSVSGQLTGINRVHGISRSADGYQSCSPIHRSIDHISQSSRAGRMNYGLYGPLGFHLYKFSCKPPYGVVTRTLENSETCCWLAPVIFPLRIEGVFHVKSCVSAVIDLACFIV